MALAVDIVIDAPSKKPAHVFSLEFQHDYIAARDTKQSRQRARRSTVQSPDSSAGQASVTVGWLRLNQSKLPTLSYLLNLRNLRNLRNLSHLSNLSNLSNLSGGVI